jgi:endonuclease YncB( thermonuclease family)
MESRSFGAVVAAVCVLLALPAAAQRAVDGDTIKLDGTTWRLWGIDAPEKKDMCGGQALGVIAAGTLASLMRDRTITCELRGRGRDRYRRSVGLCRADGEDLGAAMVELGMAWAFVRYSRDYVRLEEKAKAENLGVHAFGCDPPWDWRKELRERRAVDRT